MPFQRGDIVLIPFPYTDLTANKTRPAVIISSAIYHSARSELLLAYISSQVTKATAPLDYVLNDWRNAGLPKPSFIRPKIAAIEPTLVVHQVGKLSSQDLAEMDRRLRLAMALTTTTLGELMNEIEFATQPPILVQELAEKSVAVIIALAADHASGANPERLRRLLEI